MVKKLFIIMGFTLTTLYGVLSWGILVHSEAPKPEDSPYAEFCSATGQRNTGSDEIAVDDCCVAYHEAMDAVEKDWDESLQALMDQEIPASKMVADAYESMRTYNCWLEYICRAVEYSGYAPINKLKPGENNVSTGLTSEHIGQVPGCQIPENMKMEKEWDSFVNKMKEVPIIGYPIEGIENYYAQGKMNFFPQCITDTENNKSPDLPIVAKNFNECKQALELRSGCPPGVPDFLCTETSNAFVKVDNVLKKTNADQKASALERKLGTINPKLQVMEEHVNYVSNFLQQLNGRLKCFAAKCT